jgi:hypothetical protein
VRLDHLLSKERYFTREDLGWGCWCHRLGGAGAQGWNIWLELVVVLTSSTPALLGVGWKLVGVVAGLWCTLLGPWGPVTPASGFAGGWVSCRPLRGQELWFLGSGGADCMLRTT